MKILIYIYSVFMIFSILDRSLVYAMSVRGRVIQEKINNERIKILKSACQKQMKNKAFPISCFKVQRLSKSEGLGEVLLNGLCQQYIKSNYPKKLPIWERAEDLSQLTPKCRSALLLAKRVFLYKMEVR